MLKNCIKWKSVKEDERTEKTMILRQRLLENVNVDVSLRQHLLISLLPQSFILCFLSQLVFLSALRCVFLSHTHSHCTVVYSVRTDIKLTVLTCSPLFSHFYICSTLFSDSIN